MASVRKIEESISRGSFLQGPSSQDLRARATTDPFSPSARNFSIPRPSYETTEFELHNARSIEALRAQKSAARLRRSEDFPRRSEDIMPPLPPDASFRVPIPPDPESAFPLKEAYSTEALRTKNSTAPLRPKEGVPPKDPQDFHPDPKDLFRNTFHEILFIGIVAVANLTTQASLVNALNLIHQIGDHFGITNAGSLSWFVAGYSLTVGSFILQFGRFGDHFGYKRMFVIGMAWFAFWSVMCGVSSYSNYVFFIFARVLQGIGPAIAIPNGIAVIGSIYPPGLKKNLAFAAFGAVAPAGSTLGGVFGGLFANEWPWAFYSIGIALAATSAAASFVIPNYNTGGDNRKLSFYQTIVELDILGGSVGVAALALINFAWNQAPSTSWTDTAVLVSLISGFLMVIIFIMIEARFAPNPLLPIDMFDRDVGFVIICMCCGWAAFGIFVYYTWQFLQLGRGASPLLTAAYLSPAALVGIVASVSTGILLQFLHPAWIMCLSLGFFSISLALAATAPIDQTYFAQTFVSMITVSLGIDMSFPAGTIIMSNAVKPEYQGVAASLINTIVNYSISIGLGFAGTVEVNVADGDPLKGWRGALYMGLGLAGLGLGLSITFAYLRAIRKH